MAYCLIRWRYWPIFKTAQKHMINKNQLRPSESMDRPYLVQLKGQVNQGFQKRELQEIEPIDHTFG
jgi:hypothetical protein